MSHESGELVWEFEESIIAALRNSSISGLISMSVTVEEEEGRTLNPWIKTSRSVFFIVIESVVYLLSSVGSKVVVHHHASRRQCDEVVFSKL